MVQSLNLPKIHHWFFNVLLDYNASTIVNPNIQNLFEFTRNI